MITKDTLFSDYALNQTTYDISKMMPAHCRNSVEMAYYSALNKEIEMLQKAFFDALSQMYISRATWGLDEWANITQTDISKNLDVNTKRSNILASLRTDGITNAEKIKEICLSYTNGEVEIEEIPNEFRYIIKFVSLLGVPDRIDQVKIMINKINPAHLIYDFIFKYNTFGDVTRANKQISYYKTLGITYGQMKEVEL